MTVSLDGEWKLTYVRSSETDPTAGEFPAGPAIVGTVPGNVELDLERAGHVPELFRGDSILALREYERYDWWYARQFDTPLNIRHDTPAILVCVMVDEPHEWHAEVLVCNDTLHDAHGTCEIVDADTAEVLLSASFCSSRNEVTRLGKIPVSRSDVRLFLIRWVMNSVEHGNHYVLASGPLDLARYRAWLDTISRLPRGFPSEAIGV